MKRRKRIIPEEMGADELALYLRSHSDQLELSDINRYSTLLLHKRYEDRVTTIINKLTPDPYYGGVAEQADAKADSAIKILAALLCKLEDEEILSSEHVSKILES